MDSSTKKKGNEAKKKKKNGESKNKQYNQEALCFDEEIEFKECETTLEGTTDGSKKNSTDGNSSESKTLKKTAKKKTTKKKKSTEVDAEEETEAETEIEIETEREEEKEKEKEKEKKKGKGKVKEAEKEKEKEEGTEEETVKEKEKRKESTEEKTKEKVKAKEPGKEKTKEKDKKLKSGEDAVKEKDEKYDKGESSVAKKKKAKKKKKENEKTEMEDENESGEKRHVNDEEVSGHKTTKSEETKETTEERKQGEGGKSNENGKEFNSSKGNVSADGIVMSPKKNKSANEYSKKNSTKIQKMQSKSEITEEDSEEMIKWLQFLPTVNAEIENIVKQQLPFYNILNNPKRIKKIKNIVYNEKENEEALTGIESSGGIFNSIKLSNKEKYIIRFLSEGVNCTLSELVDLLFYVLNNKNVNWNGFPIKLVVNTKIRNSERKKKTSKVNNNVGDMSEESFHQNVSKNEETSYEAVEINHSPGEKKSTGSTQRDSEQGEEKKEESGQDSIQREEPLDGSKMSFDFFSDDEESEEDSDDESKELYGNNRNEERGEGNGDKDKDKETNTELEERTKKEEDKEGDKTEEEKKTIIYVTKEDLLASIPLLLSRKHLGENMKQVTISKNENNENECLWVWENDNYEIFPNYYKEVFKYYRELRYNISKIYKTLIKFKNSIISRDLSNVIKLQDYLNELRKRQFLECEKRSKKILNEKKKIIKKKMEMKKQEEKKKKIEEEKRKKMEEAAKLLEEKKNATLVKSDSTVVSVKGDEKKAKQQNLMMSWLTVKKTNTVTPEPQEPELEKNGKYAVVDITFFYETLSDDIVSAQYDLPVFKSVRSDREVSDFFSRTVTANTKEALLAEYLTFCKDHKKSVVTFYEKYVENREFYEEIPSVDNIDGFKIIPQIEKNVRSKLWEDNEFFLKLKESDYIRSFLFHDSSWTRPFMTLLVHKIMNDDLNVLPFYYHDEMEYENDTNEEYYEKFETVDLTTEDEENESESEASSQDMFIVPDDELNTDIDLIPLTTPLTTDINFFSLFNWKWNFEGNEKKNHNMIEKSVWKEFNLKYKENNYGCLYSSWGVENNPFKFMMNRKSVNTTLDNYQIKQLIKHSHGKITKKDVLVDQFKIKNDHVTKADMERKFKTYLMYVKCEDNRKKWMASEEGVKLFKNEELLSRIYEKRKRKLDQISRQIEEVKKQKRAHRENERREEKIKEKEKMKQQQELENKENTEIEEEQKLQDHGEKEKSRQKEFLENEENTKEESTEITGAREIQNEELVKRKNEGEGKEKKEDKEGTENKEDTADFQNLACSSKAGSILKRKNKKIEKCKTKKIKNVESNEEGTNGDDNKEITTSPELSNMDDKDLEKEDSVTDGSNTSSNEALKKKQTMKKGTSTEKKKKKDKDKDMEHGKEIRQEQRKEIGQEKEQEKEQKQNQETEDKENKKDTTVETDQKHEVEKGGAEQEERATTVEE